MVLTWLPRARSPPSRQSGFPHCDMVHLSQLSIPKLLTSPMDWTSAGLVTAGLTLVTDLPVPQDTFCGVCDWKLLCFFLLWAL